MDQDANLYAPETPNPLKALPRNILYPFYVYGQAGMSVVISLTALAIASMSLLI